jgi:hypothetical protein
MARRGDLPMKITTLAFALTIALPAVAAAQPGAAPGATPIADPAPAQAVAPELAHKLGVGLRLGGLGLESSADPERKVELGGGGLHLGYRFSARWEIELNLEGMSGELDDGRFRETSMVTLGALLHLTPLRTWDWYLAAGLGAVRDNIRSGGPDTDVMYEFAQGMFQLGGGVARRWDRVSVGAELRLIGMGRNDEELDGPQFAGKDGPVPLESGGGQLSLTGTYFF